VIICDELTPDNPVIILSFTENELVVFHINVPFKHDPTQPTNTDELS
jgi:hypothetical protein